MGKDNYSKTIYPLWVVMVINMIAGGLYDKKNYVSMLCTGGFHIACSEHSEC